MDNAFILIVSQTWYWAPSFEIDRLGGGRGS
jgi:hypothetical protein